MTIMRRPFYFMRHGEADWNVERMCIAQLDRPLTVRGRSQAEAARHHFAGLEISTVFHSPLSRAAETAGLAMHGRCIDLQIDEGLMEACLGVKQGAREDDVADPFLRNWVKGAAIDQAETYEDFRLRGLCGDEPLPQRLGRGGAAHRRPRRRLSCLTRRNGRAGGTRSALRPVSASARRDGLAG